MPPIKKFNYSQKEQKLGTITDQKGVPNIWRLLFQLSASI